MWYVQKGLCLKGSWEVQPATNLGEQLCSLALDGRSLSQKSFKSLLVYSGKFAQFSNVWFIPKVIVDEERRVKFRDAERKGIQPGDIVFHEGDLDLSSYRWQFGKTPVYSDEKFCLDPEIEALDSATATRPDIAGHPHNKEYKMPTSVNLPQTLRPSSAFMHQPMKNLPHFWRFTSSRSRDSQQEMWC